MTVLSSFCAIWQNLDLCKPFKAPWLLYALYHKEQPYILPIQCIYVYIVHLCLSPILFNLYSECLTKEALDGLRDSNIGGQIIQTVKYADDLVLMAKEETVLQGMIDKLIETGRYYDMEMNVEKTKVMRISKQPSQ